MRLFRLELKRVIKTRTTWILLAAALLISVLMAWLPVTFETRNVVEDGVEKELTGFDAIRVKRQAQAGIAGEITEAQLKAAAETAVRVLREYEKEYMYQLPTEVYVEKILPVAPLLSRVPEVYADAETGMAPGIAALDPDWLDHFYESCPVHLKNLMKLEQRDYPEAGEKAEKMYAKVKMPFVFYPGYSTNAYDYQMLTIFLLVLLCVIIAAPIYSAEYQTHADDILRCAKYGKGKLAVIKLAAAVLITAVSFALCMALHLILSNSFFGWDFLKSSMQLVFSTVSLSAMTIGQLQLAVAAAGFASLLASVSFTLFLSSRCQNTVAALALALLFFLSPIILFMASGGNGISWLRCLLPSGGVSILGGFASEMTDFNFLHIGSRCVWTPYVILGAALVEIPVFTVLTIRSYCRHSQ